MTNATTGNERIVPGQPPAEERSPRLARLARPAFAHWQFSIVLLGAIVMRVVVMVGYPPILWFNDSYNYIQDAITHVPDEVRPNGYSFFLDLLLPLHGLYPMALLQAAMGVGLGVASYALLRHRGLPWWGAILPTLPVLFDSYELHLEHTVTADPLFIFLSTIAVVILCWNDRPSVLTLAIAGLLIGYATLVRSVGEPLLVVVLVSLLARRVGWRRLATLLVAGIVPIAVYMGWFHHTYGKYALTESQGAFLYSRVSSFAECSKMGNVPVELRFLCDPIKPQDRPPASEYIWADNDLPINGQVTYTPLYQLFNRDPDTSLRFTVSMNAKTEKFAERAIKAQPIAYLSAVTQDIAHTFGWTRQPDPNNWFGNGPVFRFVSGPEMTGQIPWYAQPPNKNNNDAQAHIIHRAQLGFAGKGLGYTTAVQPWERLLKMYQRYIYLRGSFLAVIVLIGLAGVLARWRRWGGLSLLPWLVAASLIVLPAVTAGFSYRYVLAAVPVACLAAGLAFARRPGDKSVGALAADLRRHLGRGVAVKQE